MELPALDCHAHISVDVTDKQVAALQGAVIFGMTRDLDEAAEAARRYDPTIVWGCGAHPSFVATGGEVSIDRLTRRVKEFALVGEVGLDRRSGNLLAQRRVLEELLDCVATEPVLTSIHSAGCSKEIVEVLERHPVAGPILHWFTGTGAEVAALLSLDCYFSVNAAMRPSVLEALPIDRVLTETDFPVAGRRTGKKPGDTASIEMILADVHHLDRTAVRSQMYRNLRRVSVASGAIDRMPASLVDMMMSA